MQDFRNRSLDRRTLLRGIGAAVALPFLSAMTPARPAALAPVRRVVFVFSPNGKRMADWTPQEAGPKFALPHSLAPLAPWQDRLTVFSGMAIDGGRAHGDGHGDHARAAGSFLTCAHPRKSGPELHCGISVDQQIAAAMTATPFASLELGVERGAAAGICDSGYPCAYSNNISWSAPNRPVAKDTSPKAVFARLFGDPLAVRDAERLAQQQRTRASVLDAVLADAKSLQAQLGGADRAKLEQYLDAVRSLEQRLHQEEAPQTLPPLPDGLLAPQDADAVMVLHYELIALALATDRTRVVSFMLGNAGSNRSYPFLGIPEGHHELSHHGRRPEKLAAIRKIDRHHSERFAAFLAQLAAHNEGEHDVLGATAMVFASGIGDGDHHNHDQLPVLLCGGNAAGIVGGRHVRFGSETPLANLYLSLLRWMGVAAERFADSTGPVGLSSA